MSRNISLAPDSVIPMKLALHPTLFLTNVQLKNNESMRSMITAAQIRSCSCIPGLFC